MTKKGLIATSFFLTLTIGAIITEVVFAFDNSKDTHPWTDLIVRYVPWELALAALGALMLWAPIHFYVRYRRKHRKPNPVIHSRSVHPGSFNVEIWGRVLAGERHVYTECPNPRECPVHRHYITQEDLRKDDGS